MLTREVREWIQKVERKQYSYDDAMYEFTRFAPYLIKEELKQLKNRLQNSYKLFLLQFRFPLQPREVTDADIRFQTIASSHLPESFLWLLQ